MKKITLKTLSLFLSLILLAIALSSCLSGYFVAVRRVWKSACVQVGEEIVRIACTVLLLRRMTSGGLEGALLALAVANAVADVGSCLCLALLSFDDI